MRTSATGHTITIQPLRASMYIGGQYRDLNETWIGSVFDKSGKYHGGEVLDSEDEAKKWRANLYKWHRQVKKRDIARAKKAKGAS